jgi:glucan phosphoethanolaminetransferase (alkaline phosphatase superfamily)
MKDLTISGKRIKTEIKFLLFSFCLAVLINIFAIVYYKTNWIELLSQLHIVLLFSILIYLLSGAIRIVTRLIARLLKPVKN